METEEYKKRIKELTKEKNEKIETIIKPLSDDIDKLQEEMYANIVKNKEYITDLSEFEGKEISFVALDSNGEYVYLPTDEIVEVKDGKLYLSSYNNGIVYFDSKKDTYVHCYRYSNEVLDVIGFINVKLID